MKKESPFLQLLRFVDFRKLWGSQLLSQITINLINFVIILQIFETSHSTVAISLVWVFYAIPAIILGPFSGTIIDLYPKKKILTLTTFVEAIIVLGYLLAKTKVWPIYSIIFFYSLVNQLYVPAEAATLPGILPKKLLPTANSLFLFTIYGSFLASFGLAGPLIRLLGRDAPFLLGSLFLLTASYLVSRIPQKTKIKVKKIADIQVFFERVKEGYRFLRSEPLILFPILLLVLAQVVVGMIAVLTPSFATETLGIDLLDAGLILTAPAVLGAIIGAQAVIKLLTKKMRKKRLISFGTITAGSLLLILALLVPHFGQLRTASSMLVTFLLGGCFVFLIIPIQTLVQELTPVNFRGRVFGLLGFGVTVAMVLPVLLAATVADILGTNFVIFFLGVASLTLGWYILKESGEIYGNHRS